MSIICKPNKSLLSCKVSPPKKLRVCFSWVQLLFNTDSAKAENKLIRDISLKYIKASADFFATCGFTLEMCPNPLLNATEIDNYVIPFDETDFLPQLHGNSVRSAAFALHPEPNCSNRLPIIFCPYPAAESPGLTFMGRKYQRDAGINFDPNDGWGSWELSFVTINGRRISNDRMTMAHEMIHAAGKSGHFNNNFTSCDDARKRKYIPVISVFNTKLNPGCSSGNVQSPCTAAINCIDCENDIQKKLNNCDTCTNCPRRNSLDQESVDYLTGAIPVKWGAPGYFCK